MRFSWKSMGRLIRHLVGRLIRLVGLLDHRWYMKLYLPYLRRLGVNIAGTPMYISPRAIIDGADYSLISIGDRAVISSGVRILTHDFSIDRYIEAQETRSQDDGLEYQLTGAITVGARAFIGAGSILLPGAEIGGNAIVGAGSVVRGSVRSGAIVVGNPASEIGDVETWGPNALKRAKAIPAAIRRL